MGWSSRRIRVALGGGDRVPQALGRLGSKEIRDLGIRGVHAVAFSPDNRRVLANDNDKIILNAATGTVIRTFIGHLKNVSSLTFTPDGRTGLPGSWDVGITRSSFGTSASQRRPSSISWRFRSVAGALPRAGASESS